MPDGLISYYAPVGCKWVLRWALPAVVAALPHRDGLYACFGTHPPGHPLYTWEPLPPDEGLVGAPMIGSGEGGVTPDTYGAIPGGAPSGYGPGSAGSYGGFGGGGGGGFTPVFYGGAGGSGGAGLPSGGQPSTPVSPPTKPVKVPEPAALGLFGFMMAALAWARRKVYR